MLMRLWADHRNACLLSLALLVVGVVVSPWWLLAAVVPVGWVLLKAKPAEDKFKNEESSKKGKYYLLFAKKPDNEWLNQTNNFNHQTESSLSIEYQTMGIYIFEKDVNIDDLFNMRFSCSGESR